MVKVTRRGTLPVAPSAVSQLPQGVLDDLHRRLRRVEGQVQGVQRMLTEGRDCREVVHQMSAARRAFERAGFTLLVAALAYCAEHPDEAAAHGYTTREIERLFVRLS